MHERSESEVFIQKKVVRSWEILSESRRHTRPRCAFVGTKSNSRLKRHPGLGLCGIILFANKNYDSSRIGVFLFLHKAPKRKLAAMMRMGAIARRCLSPCDDDLWIVVLHSIRIHPTPGSAERAPEPPKRCLAVNKAALYL